ncbi:hypothetical protein LSM04_006390 [Trypanosoma melophagium]|uniref:uncharacterized protein n=1 Tax=Trypanosoma melophagium TaxID=715481 RepID=UPI003519E477|nr:hypothetical protein LSM04_006390 [Trypanosoma melophagium]
MRSAQRQLDVSHSKVFFQRAVHITSTSVFFTPKEGESLDFQTVCSTPKAHRELLQRNGIIAKVILTVSSASSSLGDFKTRQGRLRIWWKVLLRSGLVQPDISSVTVPVSMDNVLWPIVDEKTFTARMNIAARSWGDESLRECPCIAPVLSVEHFLYKEQDIVGRLGVIWMPNYTCSLQQWSERELSRRYVAESTLYALINQMTIGLLALRGSRSSSSSYFLMKDILVATTNTEEGPTFVLNTLGFQEEEEKVEKRDKEDVFVTEKCNMSSILYPFLPPELVIDSNKSFRNAKYDVWALGMIVYNISSGVLQTGKRLSDISYRMINRNKELPFNHASLTPSDIMRRVRRDLQPGLYSNPFIHLVLFMLAQDPLTRPSLCRLDQMLQGFLRHQSIIRFPFAIGSFDLLRIRNPENVLIDPSKGIYITKAECVLCKRRRCNSNNRSGNKNSSHITNLPACAPMDHRPAVCSPLWSTDELLPGYIVTNHSHMTYLHPLVRKLEDKEKRRCIEDALKGQKIDRDSLLQLFGGFAVLQTSDRERLITRDVMVPIPSNVLSKRERDEVITTISFTAGLPWPSQCTSQLQQMGRIQRAVPALFSVRNVCWYAWILPGETFSLGENRWMPAVDGAFVFWFNENLTPSEQDRYFLLCSVQSLTLQARVDTTTLPDHAFQRGENENETLYFSHSESSFGHITPERRGGRNRRNKAAISNAARRRCTNISAIDVPEGNQLKEGAAIEKNSPWHFSSPAAEVSNMNKKKILNGSISRHCRPVKKNSPVLMDYIDVTCEEMHDPQINLHDGLNSPALVTVPVVEATLENREDEKEEEEKHFEMQKKIYEENLRINRELTELVEVTPTKFTSSVKKKEKSRLPGKNASENSIPYSSTAVSPPISKLSERRTATGMAVPTLDTFDMMISPQRKVQKSRLSPSKTPLRIFGRWYQSRCVDAPYQSLTFYIPETGEHGRLSHPVRVPDAMRYATHTPSNAVSMAFCGNDVPLLRRNHPHCTMLLPPADGSSIIPHHALVFYDEKHIVLGLLAFRFATTSYPNLSRGELLLPFRLHSPLPASLSLVSQLNAVYFTGNAEFEDSTRAGRCRLMDREKTTISTRTSGGAVAELLRNSSTAGVVESPCLSISAAVLTSYGDPRPKCTHDDDDALPACWLGFDAASQRLMLADVQREVWHPIRFTAEE